MKHISLGEIIGIYEQVVKFMGASKDGNNQSKKSEKYAVGEIFAKKQKLTEIMDGETCQM